MDDLFKMNCGEILKSTTRHSLRILSAAESNPKSSILGFFKSAMCALHLEADGSPSAAACNAQGMIGVGLVLCVGDPFGDVAGAVVDTVRAFSLLDNFLRPMCAG